MRSIATRKFAAPLLLVSLLLFGTSFASDEGENKNASLRAMQQLSGGDSPQSSIIDVLVGASTSGNSRAPQGSQRYIRTIYYIAQSEMAAAGFPSGADINLIGFNYSVAQSVATTGSFIVYLENTADASFLKTSSLWADLIAPMTVVSNSNATIPAATGFFDVPFSGGSAFTYSGGGLYVAFEYQNASNPLSTANTALCNTAITNGLKNAFSTTALPTSVGAFSAFRPYTRLGTSLDDVLQIPVIYALGKIPIPLGNPNVIGVPVKNVSTSAASFSVSLTVKKASDGTMRYSNSQNVTSLAPGATEIVTFPGWSPTIAEDDSIIAATSVIAGETLTGNNRAAMLQIVNSNTFSYSQGTVATGGVGFNGATGDFVAKFKTNAATAIDQIQVNFNAGGQPYQIGIWDATGTGGTPGANIYSSASLTSAVGVSVIPISPSVAVNGSFYVGVRQTGTTNVSFSYQTETPIRPTTFYFTSPSGGTTWTDFSPGNSFRFMIEPRLVAPPAVDTVLVILQDTTVNSAKKRADQDSLFAYLPSLVPVYKRAYVDTAGTALPNLSNYKKIIYQETSFDGTTSRSMGANTRAAIKAWLNSGTAGNKKSLIMMGGDLGYNLSRSGSSFRDTALTQDMLKFTYRVDNGNVSAENSITGVAVDAGIAMPLNTAPAGGGFYPDGCTPGAGSTTLYRYTGRSPNDTVAAVGYAATGYTSAVLFADPRYFNGVGNTTGFGKVLSSLLQYSGTTTSVEEARPEIPNNYVLAQNYPNPFNPSTTIRYGLPNAATARLTVYNLLGQEVITLANGVHNAGTYEVRWDGRNAAGASVSTGVYFYRLEVRSDVDGANFASLKKMLFLK